MTYEQIQQILFERKQFKKTVKDIFFTLKFRRYGIGYLHLDLLYASKINDQRRYIYTTIDRVAKIAFIMIGRRKNKETGARFLKAAIAFFPYKINYLLN